jgi:hypothetical protein
VTLRPALCWSSITGDRFLHSTRFTAVAALLLASAGIAHASRNPTPPPSGIVVHLFGPHGVMTPILPDDDTSHTTAGQNTAHGATGGASTGSANSLQTSDDPSLHDILHQMFVTGDPNDPNKPASGRPGERQAVGR